MWDQKSNQLDKNSSFNPKMKYSNRYFQKNDRALEFSTMKMTIRGSEINYLYFQKGLKYVQNEL